LLVAAIGTVSNMNESHHVILGCAPLCGAVAVCAVNSCDAPRGARAGGSSPGRRRLPRAGQHRAVNSAPGHERVRAEAAPLPALALCKLASLHRGHCNPCRAAMDSVREVDARPRCILSLCSRRDCPVLPALPSFNHHWFTP
jgi:hypothetical protein